MINTIDSHQNNVQAKKAAAMLANIESKGDEFVNDEVFYELISLPDSTLRDEKKMCVFMMFIQITGILWR